MMSIEDWEDYRKRSNDMPIFIDYFTARLEQYPTVTSMMTIGSGTCENECAILTRGLSDLKDLHLIEPHESLNARGIGCMKQLNRNVKIHNHQCVVQDYHHDGSPMDLILMIHSIYYMVPDMPKLVKHMKLWLSENGKLVIVFNKTKLAFALEPLDRCMNMDEKWLCEILKAEGFRCNVDILDYTINVSDMKDNNFKWISLLINREVQENEYEQVRAIIQSMKKDESAEEIIEQTYVVTALVPAN